MATLRRINEGIRSIFRPAYDFVLRREDRWEILMAALAIAFVATGFAGDMFPSLQSTFDAADRVLTLVFLAEFLVRFLGSPRRSVYLKDHLLDLVALIPLARGVRILRLLRLLRLLRAFKGFHHAFTRAEGMANHHELGTLVIAWFGTMFLCASAFYLAESEVNPDVRQPGDAIWWGIATLTGGSTDVRPLTDEGRLITALLLVVGVAIFIAITAVFVSFLVRNADRSRSTQAPSEDHVASQLRRLQALRDEGLIDEDEFRRGRSNLLERMGI